MKKITLTEFFNIPLERGILCQTEKQAKTLLTEFHKRGKTWHSGHPYADGKTSKIETWFEEGGTIYFNNGMFLPFSEMNYIDIDEDCDIYKFEDIDLTK